MKWTSFCMSLVTSLMVGYVLGLGYASWKTRKRKENSHAKEDSLSNMYLAEEETIIREQLARNIAFFGEDRVQKIRESFVIIIGMGGVGSHAAHMLLRSGVGRLRLIDFDQTTLSSLNRHALATRADVGLPKVMVLREHFKKIAPQVSVEAINQMFTEENAEALLSGDPDFVLDCIDNLDTKVALLDYCKKHQIRVISSMGAGAKSDPSRIQIGDISETKADPLCRQIRRFLKKKHISSGIPVVFSTEISDVKLLPLETVSSREEFRMIDRFRIRILPVLGPMPAMFGNAMALYVLNIMAGINCRSAINKSKIEFYRQVKARLLNREKDIFGNPLKKLNLTLEQIAHLVEVVWSGKSAKSGSIHRLELTRWHRHLGTVPDNLVLLTSEEAHYHDSLDSPDLGNYRPEFILFVENRLAKERQSSTTDE